MDQTRSPRGDTATTSATSLELRLWKFQKRNGYKDKDILELPYARLLQLLRIDEQLEYDQKRERELRETLLNYEIYQSSQGKLNQDSFKGPAGTGSKKDSGPLLLTRQQWLEWFGYVENKSLPAARTVEEQKEAADQVVQQAIAMFRRKSVRRATIDDVEALGGTS